MACEVQSHLIYNNNNKRKQMRKIVWKDTQQRVNVGITKGCLFPSSAPLCFLSFQNKPVGNDRQMSQM